MPCLADSLSHTEIDALARTSITDTGLTAGDRSRLADSGIGDLAALAMRETAEIFALTGGDSLAIERLADALRRALPPR